MESIVENTTRDLVGHSGDYDDYGHGLNAHSLAVMLGICIGLLALYLSFIVFMARRTGGFELDRFLTCSLFLPLLLVCFISGISAHSANTKDDHTVLWVHLLDGVFVLTAALAGFIAVIGCVPDRYKCWKINGNAYEQVA